MIIKICSYLGTDQTVLHALNERQIIALQAMHHHQQVTELAAKKQGNCDSRRA